MRYFKLLEEIIFYVSTTRCRHSIQVIKNLEPSDLTVRFMLSELQRVSERWAHVDQMAENRINTYISITSGASGILLVLSQLKVDVSNFLVVALVTLLAIWLLGLVTYVRILERDLTVVGYIRAINRLRRFFVDNAHNIAQYLTFPATDSQPKYTTLGGRLGLRTVAAIICSIAFGLFCGDVLVLLTPGSQITSLAIILGLAGIIVHLWSMNAYSTFRLRKAETVYQVRFPIT